MIGHRTLGKGRSVGRARLLGSVGTAVIATLLAAPAAHAANSTYTGANTATGFDVFNSSQTNAAPVPATANGSVINIVTGPQTGTTNTIPAQTIGSNAGGNNIVNTMLLSLLGFNALTNGSASLVYQGNSGTITSTTNNNLIYIDIQDFSTGSATLDGNKLSATTIVNNSATGAAGAIPLGYDPTSPAVQPGGIGIIADATLPPYLTVAPQTTAQGSIALVTFQEITAGGSSATASGNKIYLTVDSTGASPGVAASSTLDKNSVDATYRGNNATSTVSVQSGVSPTFWGSASVVNDQRASGDAHGAVAASNSGTQITANIVAVGVGGPLTGDLSISDNKITSSALANRALAADGSAGNVILIADGMSFLGSGLVPGDATTNPLGLDNQAVAAESTVALVTNPYVASYNDLTITSSQRNSDAIVALTDDALIQATVDQLDGALVNVDGNLVEASAGTNSVGNSISNGKGGASFEGGASISSYQLSDAATTASVNNSNIEATLGNPADSFLNSDASVSDNTVRSQAIANNSGQGLSLTSVDLAIGSGPAAMFGGNDGAGVVGTLINANANATISNFQHNTVDGTVASSIESLIVLDAIGTDVTGSGLNVLGNTQESVGIANGTTNTLSLSGDTVGTGAGIDSMQLNAGTVDALTTAMVQLLVDAPDGSDLSVSSNVQRAIAYGNTAANNGSVNANSITPTADAPPATAVLLTLAGVNADFGLLNTQFNGADVTASVTPVSSPFLISSAGDLLDSSATLDKNILVAAAYGNDAANALVLAFGNVPTAADMSNIGAVNNFQLIDGGGVSANFTGAVGPTVNAAVDGTVDHSQVSETGNQLQALAVGNQGDSSLHVSGVNITSDAVAAPRGLVDTSGFVDASFAMQNNQVVDTTSPITASLVPASGFADVELQTTGSILFSGVDLSGNTMQADATANLAMTALGLDVTGLEATAGALNMQVNFTDVTATLGGGLLAPAGGVQVVSDSGTVTDSTISIANNTRSASATGNSGDTSLNIVSTDITAPGLNTTATVDPLVASADFTVGNGQVLVEGVTIDAAAFGLFSFDMTVPTVGITDSTLSVDGNSQKSSALGNTGSNSLTLTATNLLLGKQRDPVTAALLSNQSGIVDATASSDAGFSAPALLTGSSLDLTNNDVQALAIVNQVANLLSIDPVNIQGLLVDPSVNFTTQTTVGQFVLQNLQSGGGIVSAIADASFGNNDALQNPGVLTSGLQISGNTADSRASNNEASNTVLVDGSATNFGTAALFNDQAGGGSVTATTNFTAGFTLSTLDTSTASVNGNTASSLAQGSGAVNSLTFTGGLLNGSSQGQATADTTANVLTLASGDVLLVSTQSNDAMINGSTKATFGMALNGTASDSTQTVSSNAASSSAFGNAVGNTLTVSGINNGAGAALANNQANSGQGVTASSSADFSVSSTAATAVTDGAVAINKNSVNAVAAGNSASNALNYSGVTLQPLNTGAGATYSAGVMTANGDALVLNAQSNGAPVTATATITNASINLGATGAVSNSSLAINGNSGFASAAGNTAINTLSMTGVTNGASAVLANVQNNTANIAANVTANIGITSGATTNSALSVGANTLNASAVGNNAVNTIGH